jgi:hypothetical protein
MASTVADAADTVPGVADAIAKRNVQIPVPPGDGPFYRIKMELLSGDASASDPKGDASDENGNEKTNGTIIASPTLLVPRGVPAVIAWGNINGDEAKSDATDSSRPSFLKLPEKHRLEVTIHHRGNDETVTLTAVWKNTSDFVDLGQSQSTWKTRAYRTTRKVLVGKKSILGFDARDDAIPNKMALRLTVEELDAAQLRAEHSTGRDVR